MITIWLLARRERNARRPAAAMPRQPQMTAAGMIWVLERVERGCSNGGAVRSDEEQALRVRCTGCCKIAVWSRTNDPHLLADRRSTVRIKSE